MAVDVAEDVAARSPDRGAEQRSWRRVAVELLVSPRSADPARRRPGDLAAFFVGAGIVVVAALRAGSPSEIELQLGLFFNRFPEGWSGVLTAVLGLGALWVVASMAGLGFIARRRLLSIELVVAGLGTWAVGRVLVSSIGRRQPPTGIRTKPGMLQQFPVVRIAVAVAIVVVAVPYLTRLARWLGWLVVTAMAIAAAARGVGMPNDIIGAAALGWSVAAGVLFVFGSPFGRPALHQIEEALAELGIATTELRFSDRQEAGSTTLVARDPESQPVFIRAYGRDERDAQLLSKLWRFVWYEDSGPTLYLTRLQHVEHEAYAMLVARQAGVPVAEVLAAATAGPGTAMLVERRADGGTLADSPLDLTEDVLDSIWAATSALRDARIAHGALDLTRFTARNDGTVVVTDFTRAVTMSSDSQLDADAAGVLGATAAAVGPDRAVAAAKRALGPRALLDVVAYLQAPVLSDWTRRALRERGLSMSALRAAAAAATDHEPPALAKLERVQPRSIAMAVFTFVGVYVLLGQLGNFGSLGHELHNAEWGWIVLAVVLSAATNIGYAMSYVGATRAHLPFGRTIILQAAGSFTNVVTPNAVGTAAINTRFLQVRGVRLGSAIASQVVNSVGSGFVQVALFVAVVPVAGRNLDLGLVPWRSFLTFVVAVSAGLAVVVAITWQIPQARRFFELRVRPALTDVQLLVRSPANMSLVVAGNILVQLLYALSLGAICRGFGVNIALSTLLLVSIGSSAVSGLVPVPGGLGVAEATLAGALAAAGVPSAIAVATSLMQRLITTWLPTIPGWFALRSLEKDDDL